jgi:hypothetical protein
MTDHPFSLLRFQSSGGLLGSGEVFCTEDVWGVLSLFHLWSLFLNSLHFQDFTIGKKTFTTVTDLAEKFVVELTDFWYLCCYGFTTVHFLKVMLHHPCFVSTWPEFSRCLLRRYLLR